MKKFGMIAVGGFLGVLLFIAAIAVVQQLGLLVPGGNSSSTTTAPTTSMPKPTEAGMTVVTATDLVEAKRLELVAIPADQTAAIEAKKAEYSQARALLVDAQTSALPKPSMLLSWVQLAISMAMMIFMIIVVVVILRSQPPKAKPQLASSTPPRRQTTPKPPVAPVPPTPPVTPKHRRPASTPAPWPEERAFESWFYDQPSEVQPLLKKERMSWPPGQETERWVALRAAMAAQAASTA